MQRCLMMTFGLARSKWWTRGRNAGRAAVMLVGVLAFLACGAGAGEAQEVPNTRPVDGLRQNNPNLHALVGARVVVAPGQVIESATVIIREGVIVEVGPKATVPAGARVWDLTGKTIYAGFIDAYGEAEFADVDLRAGAPHWNTQVVPQLQVAEHYKADGGALEKLRRQGFGARLVAPSAGIIKGVSALVSTGDEDASRAILQPHVAQHLRLTLSRGGGRGGFPNSPMGAVALARQTLLDTQWYRDAWKVHTTQPSLPAPERNDALDALQTVVSGELLTIADASDEQFVLRADQFAREFQLRLAIRGSGREYRRLEAIRALDRTLIVPVDFPKAPNVATVDAAHNAAYDDLLHWDYAPENPGRLEKAGVRMALTTQGLKDAGEFLGAVRKAVDRGLSADGALRALTTLPAELFGVRDRLGSVEAGKLANLVVTDGDIFSAGTKVQTTWVAGRPYEWIKPLGADLSGSWSVDVAGPNGQPVKVTLELRRNENGEYQGELLLPVPAEKPAEAKPAEAKPAEAKPAEAKPAEAKPAEAKPAEAKPAEAKPAEAKPAEAKPAEAKPAEAKPAEAKPAEAKPAEAKPADAKPAEAKPAEAKPEAKPVPEKLGLQQLAVRDYRLTATVDSEKLGLAGKSLLSWVIVLPTGSSAPAATATGMWTWPNGQQVELKLQRTAGPTAKPNDKGEKKPAKTVAGALYPVNYPLGPFGRLTAPDRAATIVFQHATIWTCGPSGVLEDASMIVREGKIMAVGRDLAVPAGATVIDARGRHLSPGIIDCHSHMATDGGINESSQSVTAEVRIGDFIDATDVNIYRQLAGGVTSAHVLHGSANTIGGQSQLIKLRWGEVPEALKFVEAPATIKFALGENVKQSNWGAQATGRYPQSRMGVEQILHDEFSTARAYQQRMQQWQRERQGLPPRRDLELDAIVEILEKRRWIHCHSYRQDEILAFLRVMELHQVKVQVLQHILEGYKVADAMARHGAGGSSFSDWWAYKFEVLDAIPFNGALMHRAGVVVSFNSDDRELARHLNHEAAKAVKYGGVPAAEALKFVTLNPARQLMVDQYVGSLEAGKHADFVVWNGPPLSTLSRCEQTWVDGGKYFDREEDRQLRVDLQTRRAALVQKILTTGEPMRDAGEVLMLEREQWTRDDEFCIHHEKSHR